MVDFQLICNICLGQVGVTVDGRLIHEGVLQRIIRCALLGILFASEFVWIDRRVGGTCVIYPFSCAQELNLTCI